MAQLRHDNAKFSALNTKILVVVPNGPFMINRYLEKNPQPYIILSDKGAKIAKQYNQDQKFFSLGTPTVFLVKKGGKILYTHFADTFFDEPNSQEPLQILTALEI